MRKVTYYWAVATVFLCAGYVVYVRTLPPDELVMANTLPFQILVSLLVVGGPCLVALLLWVLGGKVLRSLRSNSTPHSDARSSVVPDQSPSARAGERERWAS
jgi:hypothetical protein